MAFAQAGARARHAFHELATNAAKYGALSNSTGHVRITWDFPKPPEPDVLRLKWGGIGCPPVQKRERTGFDIRCDSVPDPTIEDARDVILKVTASAICGSDLHLMDGMMPTMKSGDVLGHEFIGEVVETGPGFTKFKKGDRIVVPFKHQLRRVPPVQSRQLFLLPALKPQCSDGRRAVRVHNRRPTSFRNRWPTSPEIRSSAHKYPYNSLPCRLIITSTDYILSIWFLAEPQWPLGNHMTDFDRLLEEQIPRLRRYARSLTRNNEWADDLVQDTLVRALAKQHLWKAGTNLRAWLFTLMHNQNVNNVRCSIRKGENIAVEEISNVLAATTDPTASRRLYELDRALSQLALEQRQVILLVGLEEFSYEETAAILKVPVGTVRSRLSRGRDNLRRLMDMPQRGSADDAAAVLAQAA